MYCFEEDVFVLMPRSLYSLDRTSKSEDVFSLHSARIATVGLE